MYGCIDDVILIAPGIYTGFKGGPTTADYFETDLHKFDRVSIQISICFKKPISVATEDGDGDGDNDTTDNGISGNDLVWGNDFDTPIKDQIPYGFSIGYNIFKYAVDPSIFGDVYSDKPYLYGPALTSFNKIVARSIDSKDEEVAWPGIITEENLHDQESETDTGVSEFKYLPPTDSAARRKYYLTEANRKDFTFTYNNSSKSSSDDKTPARKQYDFDFYTPYLDLGTQFAIKLPGYTLNVEGYAKGQPLRYTLKNYKTGQVYLVVVLKLHQEN